MNVQNALKSKPHKTPYCYMSRWVNAIGDTIPFITLFFSRLLGWLLTTPLLRPYNERLWAKNQKVDYEEVSSHGDLLSWFTRDALLDLKKQNYKLDYIKENNNYLSPVEATIVAQGIVDKNGEANVLNGEFNINALTKENVNFKNYPYMVLFLAPTDIHNCYFPFKTGKLLDFKYLSGKYLLTNPYAIQYDSKVYEKNFRVSFKFLLPDNTIVWIIMISANLVGIINTNLKIGDDVNFGDEVGKFLLGSTVAIVTNNEDIKWTQERSAKVQILDVL